MHLVNGTGNSPSPGSRPWSSQPHNKSSRGSVDSTKTRSDPQRVRMSSGERPIGAAKGKQPDTEALCQTSPPAPYPLSKTLLSTQQFLFSQRGAPTSIPLVAAVA